MATNNVTLIILAGLPGTGKTTIARALAKAIGAMHLRIDTIEQTLRDAGTQVIADEGYRIAYALAEDNLRLGRTVIADSVNPIAITREAWHAAASRAGVKYLDVEIVCSDKATHRRRVESRVTDTSGLRQPTWQEVVAREYHAWDREHTVIDTAMLSIDQALAKALAAINR